VEMRKKYPTIYREDIDKSCHFNPNNDYLSAPSNAETINNTSPWYCFTLIPKFTKYAYKWQKGHIQIHHYHIKPIGHQSLLHNKSLYASLYLLNFLNWAVYYYRDLKSVYDNIPKYTKHPDLAEANTNVRALAIMVNSITGREFTLDELSELTKQVFDKNSFVMKPKYFLKLCRFFTRAWYEEVFYEADNAVMPVKFAHYASCYIEYCYDTDKDFNCSFNPNNENGKKEVAKIFDKKEDNRVLKYRYSGFTIELEKYLNPESMPNKKHTYTISISQHGCRHIFYMTARLGQHQYKTSTK